MSKPLTDDEIAEAREALEWLRPEYPKPSPKLDLAIRALDELVVLRGLVRAVLEDSVGGGASRLYRAEGWMSWPRWREEAEKALGGGE